MRYPAAAEAFDRLLCIMDDLREKCPWDKKQTLDTLRHLTIEETYELSDAILSKDMAEKKLGQTDFLRLMTTQLKEQDPFSPVDNQAMIAQMAQFSSVAGISEMNDALKSISTQIGQQTALLADIKAASTIKVQGA